MIGADTIVVVDGDILGKPRDENAAAEMLRRLAGRTHVVLTAVAVAFDRTLVSGVESVDVTFRDLSDDEIARYIATREPMDKAGAYGIQGFGATIVERIDGDYFAVMGLALGRMVRLMAEVGVEYRFGDVREAGKRASGKRVAGSGNWEVGTGEPRLVAGGSCWSLVGSPRCGWWHLLEARGPCGQPSARRSQLAAPMCRCI